MTVYAAPAVMLGLLCVCGLRASPQQTVLDFLHARNIGEGAPYLLNERAGGVLEKGEHNFFSKTPFAVVSTQTLSHDRVAVWTSKVSLSGFISPEQPTAFQVVRTSRGWKIDLAATLADPRLLLYAQEKAEGELRDLKGGLRSIRRAARAFLATQGRWPVSVSEMAGKTPYVTQERVGAWRIGFSAERDVRGEPYLDAQSTDAAHKSYRMSLIGEMTEVGSGATVQPAQPEEP